MELEVKHWVWVFMASKAQFCGGVFESEEQARSAIVKHRLSGVLTVYPLGMLSFDWAVQNGYFKPPRSGRPVDAELIGSYVSARHEHFHFENGAEI